MEKLLIATHNSGKIKEFRDILAPRGIEISSAVDFDLPEPIEDGHTFQANALIKARAACDATGLPALSDDSGLCVNALDGDPGIYSARWAISNKSEAKDFQMAMHLIDDKLGRNPDRSAYFIAVLALAKPDGSHMFFEGRINGTLINPPFGSGGFGYDPMFQPEGYEMTFAEMDKDEKNKISHRARAIELFLNSL